MAEEHGRASYVQARAETRGDATARRVTWHQAAHTRCQESLSMTLENGRLIIDLTGSLLTLLIIGFWVVLGWSEGFRYIVTIAIFVTLGYLLTVRADVIVSFVNGIYSFVIRFFNFVSPNLASIFPATPIIPE